MYMREDMAPYGESDCGCPDPVHPAYYSHPERGTGRPVWAVECPRDGLTTYATPDALTTAHAYRAGRRVPTAAKHTRAAVVRMLTGAGFHPVGRAWRRETDGATIAPARSRWAVRIDGATRPAGTLTDAAAYVAAMADGGQR